MNLGNRFSSIALVLVCTVCGFLLAACGKVSFSASPPAAVITGNGEPISGGNICDPFGTTGGGGPNNGLVATSIRYFGADQYDVSGNPIPQATTFNQIWNNADGVANLNVFMNSINNPDSYFKTGFLMAGGQQLTLSNGKPILEYFALKFASNLVLGSLQPGSYQLAVLSDDAAIITLSGVSGRSSVVVNGDGMHSMQMACSNDPVPLDATSSYPLELDYADGPPIYTGVIIMARLKPADGSLDQECGVAHNDGYYFDNSNYPAPTVPQTAYKNLLSRGWAPLTPSNYVLPSSNPVNPCR